MQKFKSKAFTMHHILAKKYIKHATTETDFDNSNVNMLATSDYAGISTKQR